MSIGPSHYIATEFNKTVPYVWGENPQGQLGLGDNEVKRKRNRDQEELSQKKEVKELPEQRQKRLRKRVDKPVAIDKFKKILLSEEAN